MRSKFSDKDVLQLFASLKNAENNYPQDMIESRRETFAKQAAAMAILSKASGNSESLPGTSQTASTIPSGAAGVGSLSMGTILETVLVIAIVAEAGVATYVYREKIADFFNSIFGPNTEQVANPPDNTSSDPTVSDELTVIAIPSDGTSAVTVTETPTPSEFVDPATTGNDNIGGNSQVASTPEPDGDSGLHLGQTKQPTNDPNNNDKDNNKSRDK